ncbi:MAG: ABC transporter permease [Candidatus Latescibacteria bacterium]|nr:ABC transporter permease [Candidatus Latescibacterota bacterium]NIO56300.1 ABC transporter permease [Candidatus Latescibacterota bacterium]
MRKVIWLARREYKAAVRTKGFIIGLVLAPILMGGSAIGMALFKDRVDTTDQRLAIVDRSGLVAEALVEAAEERNATNVFDKETGEKIRPAYEIEIVEPDAANPMAQRLELSNGVRDGQLHAFVEIGPSVLHPGEDPEGYRIAYYSKNAALDDLRRWLVRPINNNLRRQRLAGAGIDESAVKDLFTWVDVEGFGLVAVDPETGEVLDARQSHEGEAVGIPLIMTMLMFLMIMMGAVPLLQSVMEEKSQRIAEVLLGSIKPFQFMMGKLLGGVAVSLTSAAVYVIGGIIALRHMGLGEYIPYHLIPWFFAFMLLAIVMIGSMLAALGATCNDTKEAQSLTLPAMLPVLLPMFVLVPVVEAPLAPFATGLSLFPLFTPMLMLLRLSTPAGVPVWQPWIGLVGILLFTLFFVWAGGRIFRVAILMQGTPPRLSNILRWALRG